MQSGNSENGQSESEGMGALAEQAKSRAEQLADENTISLLRSLFDRLDRYAAGVDAERFRIDHKNSRTQIDALVGRFIKEDFEPRKIYRPTLLALVVIDNERSRGLLETGDKVLEYMCAAYEQEPGVQITLMDISRAIDVNLAAVADVMGYIVETPAAGGRSSGIPAAPNWYVIPGEQCLDYPHLNAVIEQLVEWAEESDSAREQLMPPGQFSPAMTSETSGTRSDSIVHKGWSIFKVALAIVSFIAAVLAIIAFF